MSIGLSLGLHLGGTRGGSAGGITIPTPLNNLVAGLGDSITVASTAASGGTLAQLTDGSNVGGYLTWAAIIPKTGDLYGNGKFRWGKCYATGGFLTSQIVATHLPQVLAADPKPAFVVDGSGANDAGEGQCQTGGVVNEATLATWVANKTTIRDQILANGQIPVGMLLFPHDTANYQVALARMRTEITTLYAGLPLFDAFTPAKAGGSSAYGVGMSPDGIHPSTLGARGAGLSLRDALESWLPLAAPTLVTASTEGLARYRWMNGAFERDTDTDDIPDGGEYPTEDLDPWAFTANGATLDLIARTGYSGQAWRFNKTSNPGATLAQSSGSDNIAPLLVDDRAMMFGIVAEVASWAVSTALLIELFKVTDSTVKPVRLNLRTDNAYTDPIAPFVWTQDFTVPASMGKVRINIQESGGVMDAYVGQLTLDDPSLAVGGGENAVMNDGGAVMNDGGAVLNAT